MGRTPLHFAAANGNLAAMNILLADPEINVNAQSLVYTYII